MELENFNGIGAGDKSESQGLHYFVLKYLNSEKF